MNEKEYYNLIKPYEDAMQMILSRLDTLNHTLYESSATHLVPIHNIQSRIKSKKSIEDKLIKKEKKPSLTNAKNFLMDIAGARVICYFVNDIYNLVEILKSQTDLIVMKERDYIAGPKPNGYRSYHMIIHLNDLSLNAEIQIRTIALDFWANLEHQMKYKKDVEDASEISEELKECAEVIAQTDLKMLSLRRKIEDRESKENLLQFDKDPM